MSSDSCRERARPLPRVIRVPSAATVHSCEDAAGNVVLNSGV